MNITNEYNEILQKIKTTSPKIVGIDGNDGVGKTSLAKDIEKLDYKRISLDEFLKKKSHGYFKFVDLETLRKNIKQSSNKRIVIEGVLLQKILEKLSLTASYSIYVTDSVWVYDWIEEYQGKYCGLTFNEIIKNVEQEVSRINKAINPCSKPYEMDGLRMEIYKYSYEYKPWENADVILHND